MAAIQLVEERLSALEEAVEELRRQSKPLIQHGDWIQRIACSVTDLEAFDEALAVGRRIRESDRPGSEGGR